MSTPTQGAEPEIDYEAFQQRPEFRAYRKRQRSFIFPLTGFFMLWFLGYVALAAYTPEFMAQPLFGMNVGLWLGLAQFATTFAITSWYVSFANRKLDPETLKLRAELEELERESVRSN